MKRHRKKILKKLKHKINVLQIRGWHHKKKRRIKNLNAIQIEIAKYIVKNTSPEMIKKISTFLKQLPIFTTFKTN